MKITGSDPSIQSFERTTNTNNNLANQNLENNIVTNTALQSNGTIPTQYGGRNVAFAQNEAVDQKTTFPNLTQGRVSATQVSGVRSAGEGEITAARLIASLETSRPDIYEKYKTDPTSRAKIEEVAKACIQVGKEQGVSPKILFAMATQESACGLNVHHSGSARGVTGVQPQAHTNKKLNLSNVKDCLTQTALYLKGPLVRELNGHNSRYNISASDLANPNSDKAKILMLAYRYGAGGASSRVGDDLSHINGENTRKNRKGRVIHTPVMGDYSRVARHISNIN